MACRVPDLEGDVAYGAGLGIGDGDVFGEEIGADGGFVLAGEFFGVVSVHEGSLSDSFVVVLGVSIVCYRFFVVVACFVLGEFQ